MKRMLLSLLFCLSMVLPLCVSANAADVSSEAALKTAIAAGTDVKLQNDITLGAPLTVEKSMTLDLGGKKLTYTGNAGSIITVKNATLTIIDSGAVYSGSVRTEGGDITSEDKQTSDNGGGLYIGDGGTVVLNGGWFSRCAAKENGGGVYVASGGKLHMTGDSVIGLCKAPNGGGVYVEIGGTVEMEDGSLYACKAIGNSARGGGAYIKAAGTFTMTGGQIIMCDASGSGEAYGGGVFVTSMGNLAAYGEGSGEKIEYGFRMSGGSIQSCAASSTGGNAYGGGVYVGYDDHVGAFVMEGDSNIENCTASALYRAYGGGVCIENMTMDAGFFKMNGGRIWKCEAVSTSAYSNYAHGGGVCAKSGVFEMTGGKIEGSCKSTENGAETDGGVCIGCIGQQGIMRANGGSVECTVMNHNEIVCTNPDGCTEFNAVVKNDYMDGTIRGGRFRGEVENRGTIDGGEFFARVDNCGDGSYTGIGGAINGGVFHGAVDRSQFIRGGAFEKKPQYACYVTFDVRGGEPAPETQVRLNAPATEPSVPTKGNQTFLGWYTDEACTQLYEFSDKKHNERIKEDITLYALWSGDRCTMMFDSRGGSEVPTQMGLFSGGTAPEPLDPTKDGATFLGWFTESGTHWNFTHDTMTGDITLCALWSDDVLPAPPTAVHPAKPSIQVTGSYTYNGAEQTSHVTGYDPGTMDMSGGSGTDAGDYTVSVTSRTGQWADGSADAVTALWHISRADRQAPTGLTGYAPTAEGGSDGRITGVTDEMEYRASADGSYTKCPSGELTGLSAGGYFVRYAADANHFASSDAVVAVGDAASLEECAITFNANGGAGDMPPVTVRTGANYILPACGFTAPADRTFKAWEISGAEYDESSAYIVNADTEVKALWKAAVSPAAYTVTVTTDGGGTASASPSTASAGTEITLRAVPGTGRHFKEWQIIGGSVTIANNRFTMPNGNVVVKAVFEADAPAPVEYTITFDGSGGVSAVESMTTTGQKLASLPSASRSGSYRFNGWYTAASGGTKITTDTVFSKSSTVYAQWTYTGGSGGNSGGGTVTPPATSETTTDPDGSVTKTEMRSDGSTVETVTKPDGSTTTTETKTEMKPDGSTTTTETKTETKPDGSTTTTKTKTETKPDGSTGTTTTTTENGNTKTEAEAKISEKAVEDAKQSGEAVKVPTEVKAGENSDSAPTVKVELPKDAGETKIEIPVSDVNSGTVAVIVHEDGTEEIVKSSTTTENGLQLKVDGSATIKVIDNSKDFHDTRDHWSRDEVNFVASRELFNGVGGSSFGVNEPMTRGMVNTVLARLAGVDTTPKNGQKWYEVGTEWAKANGITDGSNPEVSVTREQLAAMLYRFNGAPEVSGSLLFNDAHEISDYAENALLWAVQNGILNGVGNECVAPRAEAQRAQVAAMMARYLRNVG